MNDHRIAYGVVAIHPIELHPAERSFDPIGVCGGHLNIVHLIQHGGDAKEREEDLELGQKPTLFA